MLSCGTAMEWLRIHQNLDEQGPHIATSAGPGSATTVVTGHIIVNISSLLSTSSAARLYSFDGYIQTQQGKSPVDINNLLLRGSVLRKTPWVIGVALNVGSDSKIVQNMTQAPRKVSHQSVPNTTCGSAVGSWPAFVPMPQWGPC